MKRKGLVAVCALGITLAAAMVSYAGQWQRDDTNWKWQNDDGSYPVSAWQWIDGNRDGIAECYYFDETGHLWLNIFSPTPDGYFICLDGYAWAIDDMKQIQVVDEQLAQSIKTKLPYESPTALSLEEVIKDNSEYYGRYEGLLPGKVYTYENHRSYDDLFVDSLVSISLKSEMNNQKMYFKTITETDRYVEKDIFDVNNNLVGKLVSCKSIETEPGYVLVFGYY